VEPAGAPGVSRVTIRSADPHPNVFLDGDKKADEVLETRATGSVGPAAISLDFAEGSIHVTAVEGLAAGILRGTGTYPRDEQVALTCWPSGWKPAIHYREETGTCVDPLGGVSLSRVPVEVVRETRHGECADLTGVALNESDLRGRDLWAWDLRGARLAGATLHFANLLYADLRGADLSGLDFGYAHVTGMIDAHTKRPEEKECCVVGISILCVR